MIDIGKPQWSNFIAFASLLATILIFIFGAITQCNNENKFKEIRYIQNAVEHRPRLVPISIPEIREIFLNEGREKMQNNKVKRIESSIDISLILKFINKGNDTARIKGYIQGDTLSGEAEIRKIILDEDFNRISIPSLVEKGFYREFDIIPGEIWEKKINLNIKSLSDKGGTLHFLIFYENSSGALFDTYYWCRFSSIINKIVIDSTKNSIDLNLEMSKMDKDCLIEFWGDNSTSRLYNSEEKESIYNYFNRK